MYVEIQDKMKMVVHDLFVNITQVQYTDKLHNVLKIIHPNHTILTNCIYHIF